MATFRTDECRNARPLWVLASHLKSNPLDLSERPCFRINRFRVPSRRARLLAFSSCTTRILDGGMPNEGSALRRTAAARWTNFFQKDHFLTDQLSKNVGLSLTNHLAIDSSRSPALGRHTERTPTHTPVPPNPAVEPPPASLLNSFFC